MIISALKSSVVSDKRSPIHIDTVKNLVNLGLEIWFENGIGEGINVSNENNKKIEYFETTAEELNIDNSGLYDIVACLEVLEHVPDPKALVKTCVELLKPNGLLFLSTINKNPRSWVTAILGAEYIFNLLPKGTHEFNKFIKPSDLAQYVRLADAELIETKGMFYNPITHKANLNNDLGVNYMMYARKI